jgi:formylglycine-generating enzyme
MRTFTVFGRAVLAWLLIAQTIPLAAADEQTFTNSLGMRMVRIAPGSFVMGSTDGDADEQPAHPVTISRSFWMGATEVNNAQYEAFDPAHKKFRGQRGLSREDAEAVIQVSWFEATAFCRWLREKEHKPYRLPTEAEWEFACRAGTTGAFSTGNNLPSEFHQSQSFSWDPQPVPLPVGRGRANSWGLQDMHGNVEEWCYDLYGPFQGGRQTDPVGYAQGDFRVTRGGSHNTEVQYLRSANRMGTLPEDKHWLIGFRVVVGELPGTPLLTARPAKLWQSNVSQQPFHGSRRSTRASFDEPQPFVRPPATNSGEPFYPHNHCPAITWCDNGDLLAIWFSTRSERGREMTILASRLRQGARTWDPASEFFKAPDRNMTGSSLLNDSKGKLYHLNGLEAGDGWANLALVMRTSTNNGVTWSTPRLVNPSHQRRNQVIAGISITSDGVLIQPCDAAWSGAGGTAIHLSRDGGVTWVDPGAGTVAPKYVFGGRGGTIAGIHAGVVSLGDNRLLAFGRGDEIDGKMPQSLSEDMGTAWAYSAGPWPPISSGQRLVLMRLREGPLLFASFTDSSKDLKTPRGMPFRDDAGNEFTGYGLFAALSFDEGKTWGARRLITAGSPARQFDGGAWTRNFIMDATHAEPRGYLAATQTPDGVIHLVSSALYYRFDLAWLKQQPKAGSTRQR